jgi:hypothetical protein
MVSAFLLLAIGMEVRFAIPAIIVANVQEPVSDYSAFEKDLTAAQTIGNLPKTFQMSQIARGR